MAERYAERYAEIVKKPPSSDFPGRGPVDMTVYPNGNGSKKPDGLSILQEIRGIQSLVSPDVRRIRRRRKWQI